MAAKAAVKIDYPTTEAGMLAAAIEEAHERGDAEWAAFLSGKLATTRPQFRITEASGSTFAGGGDGRATAQAAPKRTGKLSEDKPAQWSFLASLYLRKMNIDITNPQNDIDRAFQEATEKLTSREASAKIDTLKPLPDASAWTERNGGKREPVHYPTIPAGWYRIEDVNYKVSQPTKGNWVGWTFIEDEPGDKYRGAAAKELLDLIATDPFAYATAYGKATSVCGCCLTALEHPASVELGIGPYCAENYGYGELWKDTAARLEGRTRRTPKTKIAQEEAMTETTTATPAKRARKPKATPATETAASTPETTQEASKATRTRTPKAKPENTPTATVETPNATPGAPQGKHADKEAEATANAAAARSALEALTLVELREVARAEGMSTGTKIAKKAELIRAITAYRKTKADKASDAPVVVAPAKVGKGHKIAKPEAPALSLGDPQPLTEELMKARTAKGLCELCGKRRLGAGKASGYDSREYAKSRKWCLPCADESQHEIEHDNGHEHIPTDECWICHPELNAASEDYTPRVGTSKAGMVIHAKGSAADRAAVALEAVKAKGGKGKVATDDRGVTVMEGKVGKVEIIMTWHGKAHAPDHSTVDGKRVKNVATFLRMVGALA